MDYAQKQIEEALRALIAAMAASRRYQAGYYRKRTHPKRIQLAKMAAKMKPKNI